MDKETAYKNLDNCFSHYDTFDTPEIRKALIMGDQATLDQYRKRYQAIMDKKAMYKAQIDAAVSNDEVAQIIGSVNLSDVVSDAVN